MPRDLRLVQCRQVHRRQSGEPGAHLLEHPQGGEHIPCRIVGSTRFDGVVHGESAKRALPLAGAVEVAIEDRYVYDRSHEPHLSQTPSSGPTRHPVDDREVVADVHPQRRGRLRHLLPTARRR